MDRDDLRAAREPLYRLLKLLAQCGAKLEIKFDAYKLPDLPSGLAEVARESQWLAGLHFIVKEQAERPQQVRLPTAVRPNHRHNVAKVGQLHR